MRRRRTYLDYVRDMLAYVRQAKEFLRGVDLEQFRQDVQVTTPSAKADGVVTDNGYRRWAYWM